MQPDAPLSVCRGHASRATHIAFLPTAASVAAGLGRVPLLLSGSADWTARVWDAETGCCRGACVGHGGALTALQVVHGAACGTRLLTGGADGTLGVWRLDGELVSLGQRHTAPVMLLQQGGDTLVSGASDKSCHVWGLQQVIDGGSCSGGGSGSSNAGGMPLDHNRSAVSAGGSSSSGQRLQQHHHAQQLLASQRKRADVAAMAFDPVGELLCSGHRDGIVSVWNCSFSMQQQHVGC
jgi:WD40 repeat protein